MWPGSHQKNYIFPQGGEIISIRGWCAVAVYEDKAEHLQNLCGGNLGKVNLNEENSLVYGIVFIHTYSVKTKEIIEETLAITVKGTIS
jgi:hypothetical protein